MLGSFVEQLSNFSSLHEKMPTLKSKIKDVSCREADVIVMLQDVELRTGKKRKRQVDNWLGNVQKKTIEFQSLEQDVQGRSVFQKPQLGKHVEKMIGEVVELVEQGRFSDQELLLDVHDIEEVPLLTENLIGQEFKRNLEKIQDCLKKDEILRIGIYGMAGVGKTTLATHIHNILLERYRIFDHVYWVTVSQGYSIRRLQNDIASVYRISLVKVGIPCGVNGCKLILTSRSLEVCRKMECQEMIKVETLSEEEAWTLFMEKLGHGMTPYSLNKLENACLLESCVNKYGFRSVKMHDLMREMALKITRESPRFMVKAGVQLCEIPEEHEWNEDLEKVSLMDNKIEEIPEGTSPRCQILTLMLQNNYNLRRISNSFFTHMRALRVLDFSRTGIVDLPSSISDLVNLTALLLYYCRELLHVPPLGKLRALQVLKLSGTRIKEVPQGMEMLVNLKYLYMDDMEDMMMFPSGVLPRLSRLQVLILDPLSLGVQVEEVEQLENLEKFEGQLYGMCDFKRFLKSGLHRQLNTCRLRVDFKEDNMWFDYHDKEVSIGNCRIMNGGEDVLSLLPSDIQSLDIEGCDDVVCSSFIDNIINARGLKECRISRCVGIECFLSLSSDEVENETRCVPLKSLETLELEELQNLSALIKWEGSIFATPHGAFSSLKRLWVTDCHKIKMLLPPRMLQHLPDLEEISVHNCYQMEEIIGDDGEEMDRSNNYSSSSSNYYYYNNSTIFTLPKLIKFSLIGLPKLKSICRGLIACDSLKWVSIYKCKKLKRIPFSLPLVDGQPSPPTDLKSIEILRDEELWWESLEWNHPNAKDILRPFLKFCY